MAKRKGRARNIPADPDAEALRAGRQHVFGSALRDHQDERVPHLQFIGQ